MEPTQNNQKYILHFDVNKTVIFTDSIHNKTIDKSIQKLVFNGAWGIIEGDYQSSTWTLAHDKLTSLKPDKNNPKMINYQQFLKIIHSGDNPQCKYQRQQLRNEFFTKKGPGAKLKSEFEKFNKMISIPKYLIDMYDKILDKTNEELNEEQKILYDLKNNFLENKVCLFPSFFKFLIYLRKNKIEFGLVFRTFGMDLEMVKKEFNYFISGNHPMFNGKNGTTQVQFQQGKQPRNFELLDKNLFKFYRLSDQYDQTLLFKNITSSSLKYQEFIDQYHIEIETGQIEKIETFNEIFLELRQCLRKNASMGFQDDYKYYFGKKLDRNKRGKLFLIDKSDFDIHEIFFDDNVQKKELIDSWDIFNKERLNQEDILDKFLVEVDTLQVAIDSDYFIKKFQQCLQNREQDYQQHIQQQQGLKNISEKLFDEVQYLKQCDHGEYLTKTVFPLLEPAFRELKMKKPDEPIPFLAHYLLENKYYVQNPNNEMNKN